MNYRYKIRTFEARESVSTLVAGTVVVPMDIAFSLDAASLDDVERMLCESVGSGKLAAGRVYQICPSSARAEAVRSVAIDQTAIARRVTFETNIGMYSLFRRISYADEKTSTETVAFHGEAVPA